MMLKGNREERSFQSAKINKITVRDLSLGCQSADISLYVVDRKTSIRVFVGAIDVEIPLVCEVIT